MSARGNRGNKGKQPPPPPPKASKTAKDKSAVATAVTVTVALAKSEPIRPDLKVVDIVTAGEVPGTNIKIIKGPFPKVKTQMTAFVSVIDTNGSTSTTSRIDKIDGIIPLGNTAALAEQTE